MAQKFWLPVFDPLGMVEKLTENTPIQLKDPIRQMFKRSSGNPSDIPGAKVPGGRYAELPTACECITPGCGYRIESPGEHCATLRCPKCGARLWRVK